MYKNDPCFLEGTNGAAVLLMHGLTSGAAQMVPMARYLNDFGYTVRCVNLAGHGTYPEDLLHTTAEDLIAKAEYDYADLASRYDRVYVGGVSTGGLLGLYLAAQHPEIRGVVSVSAPMWLVPGSFISRDYPPEQVWLDRPLGVKPGLFRKYHIHYEKIAVRIFDELRRLMDIVRDASLLERVTCPVLAVQAADDDVADPESVDHIIEHIGSTCTPLRLETGGHLCLLNTGCYHIFAAARKFLDAC